MNPLHAEESPEPNEQADDRWSVRKGTYDGKPIIVRLNDAFAGAASGRFSFRVGLAALLKSPDATGFPTPEESIALGRFENDFVSTFCADGDGWLAAVISTNGLREFVLYVADEGRFRGRFRAWARTPKSHQIQMTISRDKGWTVYKQLAKTS